MTPSEKEKIIKDSYEAIKDLYILRNELLTDAGKLEAAKESNRKLSDRVANLEETIKALNSAIDKKDVEIKRLNNRLKSRDDALLTTIEALEENRDAIYNKYLDLAHKSDADEEIKRHMIADNRKKKDEIKRLKEELEAEKKFDCCDRCCNIDRKLAKKYKSEIAELESNFHELREKFSKLYLWYIHDMLQIKDVKAFTDWFTEAFGKFGVYNEEK